MCICKHICLQIIFVLFVQLQSSDLEILEIAASLRFWMLNNCQVQQMLTMRMMIMRGKPRSAATVASAAARSACAARVKHHARLQLQQLLRLLAGRAWASSQGDFQP